VTARSEAHESFSLLQSQLRTFLKPHGFRARGLTFNRSTPDTLVHVLQLQAGRFDPPGMVHIPGFRENMFGKFTINLGIFVPEVAKHSGFKVASFVSEVYCCIRARLGEVGPETADIWWDVDNVQLNGDLKRRLERDAFPFFARYQDRDAILRSLAGQTVSISGGNPPRIICAIILAERGEGTKARKLLSAQAMEFPEQGHASYVHQLAIKLGLGSLDS
jgi:hypothetical protein